MRLILNILLVAIIAATICICSVKPSMHKSVLVFDSAYKIVLERQMEVESETIPIMEKTQEPVQTVIKKEIVKEAEPKTKVVVNTTQNKSTQKVVPTVTKNVISTQKVSNTHVVKQTGSVKPTDTNKKTEQKIVEKPKVKEVVKTDPIVVKQQPQVQQPVEKVLTQKEEEIAWNTWRSNLQNKIMQDVKLPIIPTGVVFKFSFKVDKFGKVSNVQTWSTTPTYTPYAIQYIAPVIRSYQGKSVLNFPAGTSRVTTDVTGGWKISENEKYSTPQDYNDYETVRR